MYNCGKMVVFFYIFIIPSVNMHNKKGLYTQQPFEGLHACSYYIPALHWGMSIVTVNNRQKWPCLALLCV